MKKNVLLFLLLFTPFINFSQSLKPFNLADFEGKKIISTFKSTSELRGELPEIYMAPTNQYHTVNRTISIRKKEDTWLVEKMLSKINILVENMITHEGGEYDSERKFDRVMEVSMVYGMYDKFINKPYRMVYDKVGKRIDTLANFGDYNFYYDYAWDNKMPPYVQEDWVGIFQISHPTGDWKVGQTWQQTLTLTKETEWKRPNKERLTSTYTVKSIDNNKVLLALDIIHIPELTMYKHADGYVNNSFREVASNYVNPNKDIDYTIGNKHVYKGTILFDSLTNLVLKMDIDINWTEEILIKDAPPSGRNSTKHFTIENRVEDLK